RASDRHHGSGAEQRVWADVTWSYADQAPERYCYGASSNGSSTCISVARDCGSSSAASSISSEVTSTTRPLYVPVTVPSGSAPRSASSGESASLRSSAVNWSYSRPNSAERGSSQTGTGRPSCSTV